MKNKEGGAEPRNPGLGRRHSGGGEAATLGQLCCLSSFSASRLPRAPARVGHELPSPKPLRCPVLRGRPGTGQRPRHPYTHHVHRQPQGTRTQACADTEACHPQRPPTHSLRNPGNGCGGCPHSHIYTGAMAAENPPTRPTGLRFGEPEVYIIVLGGESFLRK